MQKISIITGQTATGKTSYALQLARQKNGELINADSRQIYKYLDIITGKDTEPSSEFFVQNPSLPLDENRHAAVGFYIVEGIKIWGYDIVDPKEHFSSHDYTVVVDYILRNAIEKNKLPIVVGGSYLYIKHLLYGVNTQAPPDWNLRASLDKKSVSELTVMLKNLDSVLFEQMNESDRKNPRRLMRKIEIAQSKAPIVQGNFQNSPSLRYELDEFTGFSFESREKLEETIRKRVEKRLAQGALAEVSSLLERGYTANDPGLRTIGYQQLIDHIKNDTPLEQAVEKWITAEVQYAKRQYTFMKKDQNITWR